MKKPQARAINDNTIILPAYAAKKLGLSKNARLDIVAMRGRLEILPDIHSLSRLYIEPTSRCNISCRTCIRQTWNEPQGDLSRENFKRILAELPGFPHLDSVMLGGFGEPTAHPDIIRMVSALKKAGLNTEMVSNGTLLDAGMRDGLLKAGLDRLWISFDGADDTTFERTRQGARFREVVENIKPLRGKLELGIAFVVTRANFNDLKNLGWLAKKTGAEFISVSNVIPYSPEMEKQMVCSLAIRSGCMSNAPGGTAVDIPRIDLNDFTRNTLWSLANGNQTISLMGTPLGAPIDRCRFIRERCTFIRWDGKVAPCMALMHSHKIHIHSAERHNKSHSFGDITKRGLNAIWNSKDYVSFREKVSEFNFSPCHACGGCSYSGDNTEDCGGNLHPATCGGCLWAQGVIQCP
ncbi:MAG: hypothetical protein A2X34_04245 [Elusimicrobia bacterium GWC2_51_8]|nr:MAG: hypothetical protein A2X33_00670 [Elusimicrobia bacterium GWA2_51_34]OGR63003.1 MAG: hypothetical protein A2X34_04245 [Elusimicrobia bacterium GWC2_51_8]OGR85648.1 MAG: hypothetical protein A2021_08655 [Elusimicrobia bacterium GWF2_52_66]HAF96385.1 radical SAM protein [Elusimicrobiota bacterium]HCE98571.1 radical SAM protein [Elusimicrobiota bacterium]